MTDGISSPDLSDPDVRLRNRLFGFLGTLRANGFPLGLDEAGDALRLAAAADL